MSVLIDQETFDKKYDEVYKDIMENYNINYESAKEVFKTIVKANNKGIKVDSLLMMDVSSKIDSDITLKEIGELEKNLEGIYIDGMF